MAINARCCYFLSGQHSLTSVERPSYLQSDFVNVWRDARHRGSPSDRLPWLIFVLWSDVCFEVLSCFFDHPSIDSTKKMPLHLFGKDFFKCFASIKPLSALRSFFQRMLLSNIPWISPDRMAFMKKLHEQANKTQMNRCPIWQLFQILASLRADEIKLWLTLVVLISLVIVCTQANIGGNIKK